MARAVKRAHEFRDPLHDFVVLDRQERLLVDSKPFQRLRHIHQLALTYLVYPGASHQRFEHSLGVMHLASMIFDVVTHSNNIHPDIANIIPDRKDLPYWKKVLRLAALCHDMGHVPFSHAAEKQLLPKGEDHESLTLALIESDALKHIWKAGSRIDIEDVKKLSVGRKKLRGTTVFDDWETILAEMLIGDAFGADRIDYLLRDSYHLGVSYGKFDHLKLIESLRILPRSATEGESKEPYLGIEEDGVHSAEALLLARYFMYEQVYFHNVRRSYDKHLIDFMKIYYGLGGYKLDVPFHLHQTDYDILVALRDAASDPSVAGHRAARAIMERGHFRTVYRRNPSDELLLSRSIESGSLEPAPDTPLSPAYYIHRALAEVFNPDDVYTDLYIEATYPNSFPVLMFDGRIEDSVQLSTVLASIPPTTVDYIFADPAIAEDVIAWISDSRESILRGGPEE